VVIKEVLVELAASDADSLRAAARFHYKVDKYSAPEIDQPKIESRGREDRGNRISHCVIEMRTQTTPAPGPSLCDVRYSGA
jgi:hypothetical protein